MPETSERPAEIVPAMVGTAGHVDHGKTSLVKLLTGCDTDRLKEEKERGLTIDLGFAPCRLPGNRLVGIVDVPGHEDFIRNMVAGAASIDILMLVVAADDGVMPQTREHLQIVRLLRTARVMAALTKIDLVDADTRRLAQEETAEFLARSGFPDAPVLPVSNRTLEGIGGVRNCLRDMVDDIAKRPDRRSFRMNVERVFSVKGYGTVATGIPISGRLAPGETAELVNAGTRHAVRAVQTYRQNADAAVAGACAALNLRDLPAERVERGLTLAAPGAYAAATTLVARVANVSEGMTLKRLAKVKFHSGTAVTQARVKLLTAEALPPGGEAFAHLRLEQPLVAAAGDRFVLRSLAPVATCAGGVVLAAGVERLKRGERGLADRLRRAAAAAEAGRYAECALLAGTEATADGAQLALLSQGLPAAEAAGDGVLLPLGGECWLVREKLPELQKAAEAALRNYHAKHPYVWGMEPGAVCKLLKVPAGAFKNLAKELCARGELKFWHGRLALAEFAPALNAAQIELRETILRLATEGGINAPAVGNIAKEYGPAKADLRLVTRLLTEEGLLLQVGPNLLLRDTAEDCRRKFLEIWRNRSIVTLNDFRTATGAGRNLAVALLESFDAASFSRREGDGRVPGPQCETAEPKSPE